LPVTGDWLGIWLGECQDEAGDLLGEASSFSECEAEMWDILRFIGAFEAVVVVKTPGCCPCDCWV